MKKCEQLFENNFVCASTNFERKLSNTFGIMMIKIGIFIALCN